ncbi:hypothetical protein ABZ354_13535 [Streptomyces sp. NPDC005925]|uniref:hypothetical protein n=1 Tax=Streptomyces sp. NPDC005925 TaxID=3157172 RepID=UPI0033D3F899
MGIRMLHHRTAPTPGHADALGRVSPPPVPAHAATASTVRAPATFASALRRTAEDLRRLGTPRDPVLRALALGDASRTSDPPLWRQWTNVALGHIDRALRGPESRPGEPLPWRQWAAVARARLGSAAHPGVPFLWRQWAELARGYLALALAALPGPRPVQTVTVFVAAPQPVTGHPYGRAPRRRRRDGRGPGPDATA